MSDDDEGGGMLGTFIKWGIILLLSAATGGTFLVIYLGWKYVKLCIIFYFKALYLIIRIPIWLFIQLPLHYLGVGMHVISNALSKAYGIIMARKKRYGLLYGLLFLFMLRTFLPSNTDAMMSMLTEATLILPFLVLVPFIITFVVALISSHFHMPDIARKEMPGGLNTGTKRRTAEAATAAAAAGQMGMKAYNNREEIKAAKDTIQGSADSLGKVASEAAEGEGLAAAGGETILASDMVATLEGMPLIGSMVTGAGAGAGSAASAGSAVAGASATTGAAVGGGVLVGALILAVVGFIVISIILSALIVYLAGIVVPMILGPILGPIMGAIGLGQAYGGWIGSEVANNFLPQIDLTGEMRMIEQAGAKIGCALQGPACLRQWRLNNTARPGSKDVGEKYRLEIQGFSVGGQGGVDIAYKRPSYRIPVSFLLLNTRHGLKGIDARDVEYRVRVIDADRKGKKAYCTTQGEDGSWVEVGSTIGEEGTILPGTSYSPRLNDLEGLTLKNCEMLQPALGHDYTGELDVKYKYSSQSTLYVRAMSRRNMRDEGITPGFKKSETADTPVETFINVKEPINYVEGSNTDSGAPRTVPFTVKVGTNTDRYDVEYRVHPDEFKVFDSARTETTEDGSCIGLERESRNVYGLSTEAISRMNARIDEGDTSTWFDKAKNPAAARCTFELSNPGTISPTGETLTMRVDANYTVIIEETSDPFEVKNTMCSRINCPVLFWMEPGEFRTHINNFGESLDKWDEESEGGGLSGPGASSGSSDSGPELTEEFKNYRNASCDGIDAGNGCSAVEEYRFDRVYQDPIPVDDGELAVEWTKDTAKVGNLFSCKLRNGVGDFGPDVIGVPQREIGEVRENPNKVFKMVGEDLVVHDYTTKISYDAFASVPDWIADAEYSQTKKATGCYVKDDGTPVPEFTVSCRDIDVGGVGAGLLTGGAAVAGGALYLATSGGSCGGGGG